jgi:ribosomal protein L30E
MTIDERIDAADKTLSALDLNVFNREARLMFIESLVKASRRDGIEASAKIADVEVERELTYSKDLGIQGTTERGFTALKIANNIRALIEEKA